MPGVLPGSGRLDAPPPAPGPMGNAPNPSGQLSGDPNQMPTLSGLAAPAPIGAQHLPPEILTGILTAGEKIGSMFDSFAQVTPDLAADWDLLKQLLQQTLGKILVAGGTPTSPNNPGKPFPGGGVM